MHPLSIKRIYESVVLSKVLYGSELWNGLTGTNSDPRTGTRYEAPSKDAAHNTYTNCSWLLSYDHTVMFYRQGILVQLGRIDTSKRIKTMFNFRLYSFMYSFIQKPGKALGVMPDI